jgi:hypothetical protein
MLEVEYAGGEWVARCAGVHGAGPSALEAISTAVRGGPASIFRGDPALDAWVVEHAERLESEAG